MGCSVMGVTPMPRYPALKKLIILLRSFLSSLPIAMFLILKKKLINARTRWQHKQTEMLAE